MSNSTMGLQTQCQHVAVLVPEETIVKSLKQYVTTCTGDTVIAKHTLPHQYRV
jgi:hypothetical protein